MQDQKTFRSSFAETIFNNKYRHDGAESWPELARTLVDDVMQKIPDDIRDATYEIIRDMKFIPGGRYLYYAGRPFKAYNNCGHADTRLLTDRGWVRFGDVVGQTLNVWSPVEGAFLPAVMHEHGQQPLNEITFTNVRGTSKKTWTVKFTPDHKWPLLDGGYTSKLKIGNVVPANALSVAKDSMGTVHGFVFADGALENVRSDGMRTYRLRLCGNKAQHLNQIQNSGFKVTRYTDIDGDPFLRVRTTRDLKAIPTEENVHYVAGFLEGWSALDGHFGQSWMLHSINEAAIDFFIENAALLGYVVTGEKKVETKDSNYGPRKPLYRVNFADGDDFAGFKVKSIKPIGEDTVYCPFEPKHNRIVIDHGIDTYQCFILRSEEDSREDWANLSYKSESCLMTGGGIGNDYSRYRGKGTPLKRTGGQASGPIPKMQMINEIGRHVMQGGSRRSAIYASLDATHDDIWDFLKSKNWADMPVKGTGYTIADLKQLDFNFPAPLDMTNISVNYKSKWIEDFWRTGDVGPVFEANVRQALKTAEPGFSFNFFENENETLRNACTEVTSEDDSDCCNLGSLNMGRIDTITDFIHCVELATLFLLCGTFRAHVPYDKVAHVRDKNRRLGLGLMGMHEWLIRRNSKYEVTPELHQWLAAYKGYSNKAARHWSRYLNCNEPVKKRAIAPTGTIGILAGTTTGIEPMFAVAYKRRYLKNGTDWHYQYVVDSTAQELIDLYGVDPDEIESALDLAKDYERRIKFQADVQDYVDMAISSTINLPAWGSEHNNEDTVKDFARTLAKYAHRLRGFTAYPDGARGGQPLTPVPYREAVSQAGIEFKEHDICTLSGKGGTCGV